MINNAFLSNFELYSRWLPLNFIVITSFDNKNCPQLAKQVKASAACKLNFSELFSGSKVVALLRTKTT